MSLREFASRIRNIKRIRNTILPIALFSLSMSFHIDMKMILLLAVFRFTLHVSHHLLNLGEYF